MRWTATESRARCVNTMNKRYQARNETAYDRALPSKFQGCVSQSPGQWSGRVSPPELRRACTQSASPEPQDLEHTIGTIYRVSHLTLPPVNTCFNTCPNRCLDIFSLAWRRQVPIDASEYVFKLALLQKKYDAVVAMIRNKQLCGQAIIAYLQVGHRACDCCLLSRQRIFHTAFHSHLPHAAGLALCWDEHVRVGYCDCDGMARACRVPVLPNVGHNKYMNETQLYCQSNWRAKEMCSPCIASMLDHPLLRRPRATPRSRSTLCRTSGFASAWRCSAATSRWRCRARRCGGLSVTGDRSPVLPGLGWPHEQQRICVCFARQRPFRVDYVEGMRGTGTGGAYVAATRMLCVSIKSNV